MWQRRRFVHWNRSSKTISVMTWSRDAAIQRFEYSFEAVWKSAQRYLNIREGLQVASPKGAIRHSFQLGLLDEQESEAAFALVDDRNLTVHTYNRDLAISLASRLRGHARVLRSWLDALNGHLVL